MSRPLRNMIFGLAFFVATFVVGIVGYMTAGWPLLDALYMVIITIFGVGYGEVQPITHPALRLFTIAVIVAGYGAAILAGAGFVQMLTEGEIIRALGARRMTKGIEQLSGHTIVCGFGRIGRILAAELAKSKHSFVIVDGDATKIQEAESRGYLVLQGDATEERTLRQARIASARVIASVMPDDATNVFIALTASELNPALEIIARAENPASERKLLRSGATKVVMPASIGGQRMAHLITRPSAESILAQDDAREGVNQTLVEIGLRMDELKVAAGSPLVGRPMANIEIRSNQGFLIVALRRADGTTIINPSSNSTLQVDDIVIVLGHVDDTAELANRYALTSNSFTYRGVAT